MSRVERTRRASVDLLSIWNHIAEHNAPAADRTLDRILEVLQLLAQQSGRGEAVGHLRPGVRRCVIGNYLLYFEPIDDGIRLLRVVHRAREIQDPLD